MKHKSKGLPPTLGGRSVSTKPKKISQKGNLIVSNKKSTIKNKIRDLKNESIKIIQNKKINRLRKNDKTRNYRCEAAPGGRAKRVPLSANWDQLDRMHHIRLLVVMQLFLLAFSFGYILKAEAYIEQVLLDDLTRGAVERTHEIEDLQLKAQIKELVDKIHGENREFLRGVEQVLIATEDITFLEQKDHPMCGKGHILGAFSDGKIIIKDSGEELNEHTLYHEIGHNVWNKLSREKKEKWENLYLKTETFVSFYAGMNANENFAENLACYFTNYNGCKEKMSEEKIAFIESLT